MVQIQPPGGQRTADILAKFEEGGTKRPREGRHLAVPCGGQEDEERHRLEGSAATGVSFQGDWEEHRRAKADIHHLGVGIFQRHGKHKIQLLYAFERSVPIPAALAFVENARRVVRIMFRTRFRKAFQQVVSTGA